MTQLAPTPPAGPSSAVPQKVSAAGFGLYFLAGALQAIYGPSIPRLRAAFGLGADTAGLIMTAHFVGAMSGIVLSGALGRRVSACLRRRGSAALFGLGCVGVGLATPWPAPAIAALVAGLGYGGLVLGLSTLFGSGFGAKSPAMLSLLNATFGVGAMAGPLAVGLMPSESFGLPFLMAAMPGLLFAMPVGAPAGAADALPSPAPASGAAGGELGPAGGARAGALKRTGAFFALFFLYCGAENAIGGWQATHLISTGLSEAAAANYSGLFWGSIAVGRFLVVPISLRVAPDRLVVFAMGAALLLLQLAHLPSIAPAAYALVGLALAPVFPCSLVWLLRSGAGARGDTAPALIGACVGGAASPALVGRVLAAAGPGALPMSTAAILGAGLLLAFGIRLSIGAGAAGPSPERG